MNYNLSELNFINDAAKAMKQKDVIVMRDTIVGIDNVSNILIYTMIGDGITNINLGEPRIFNQRNLAANLKNLVLMPSSSTFNDMETGAITDKYITLITENMLSKIHSITQVLVPEEEIPDAALSLGGMVKADGSFSYMHHGYLMSLIPSVIPIAKNDKLFVTIYKDILENAFIAGFRVSKKKFTVNIFIRYINPFM